MPQRTKCLLLGLAFASASFAQKYTAQGELISPPDYREWVYLSTGIGMDYSKEPSAHPVFDNVFVNPQAYKAFMKTGSWPDKTMLVKENRASDADPLSNGGKVQTKVVSHEVHVKDASHGGWVFYMFRPGVERAKAVEKQEVCTDCHGKNGDVETTFVQYYPTLVETAKQHGTLHDPSAQGK